MEIQESNRKKLDRSPLFAWGTFLLAGNAIIVFNACDKGGWAAMGYLLFVSPIYNGLLLLIGIIMAYRVVGKTSSPEYSRDIDLYWSAVIVLPLLLAIILLLLLFSGIIGGSGC